jgi:hypothetical protein
MKLPATAAVIAEVMRRRRVPQNFINNQGCGLRDPDFLAQNTFLNRRDQRLKALQCTRRAGKSSAEVIDHIEICLEFPKSKTVYFGLTIASVRAICWDIFKDYNDKFGLGLKFNESLSLIKFPNGSTVQLMGVDASARQMKKVLGQKLRKVTIDEAGSITVDMVKLCYQMIWPALSDLEPMSWLTICGTCEDIPNTFFEQVMEGEEKGMNWACHKWDTSQNPHMARQWKNTVDTLLANNPKVKETSWFRTHYLNEWCTSDDLLIIPWKKMEWLEFNEKAYHGHVVYRLSVDLGHTDASSFTMTCHDLKSKRLHYVFSYAKTGLDFTGVADEIRSIMKRFRDIGEMIVDGANKQGVEELRNRHRLPLIAAEKSDKYTYLRQLRDDVIQGNCVFNPGIKDAEGMDRGCWDLLREWKSLIWDKDDKTKEDDRCQNHCSDGALYNHRHSKNYAFTKPEDKPARDSEEYMEQQLEQEAEQLWRQEKEVEDDEADLFGSSD